MIFILMADIYILFFFIFLSLVDFVGAEVLFMIHVAHVVLKVYNSCMDVLDSVLPWTVVHLYCSFVYRTSVNQITAGFVLLLKFVSRALENSLNFNLQ